MKTMFARRSLARGAEEEEDGRDDGRRRRTDAEALAALGSRRELANVAISSVERVSDDDEVADDDGDGDAGGDRGEGD